MPRKNISFDGYIWWLDSWRGSTARAVLSLPARAMYRELCEWIFTYHGKGLPGIPFGTKSDIKATRNVLKIDTRSWRLLWPEMAEFFTIEGGYLTNSKVQDITDYVRSKQRGARGANGAHTGAQKGRLISMSIDKNPPAPQKGTTAGEVKTKWNQLAKTHDLTTVRTVDETRLRHLRARLEDTPDFWAVLDLELRERGAWALEHRFPTFDQAVARRIWNKLSEGNYRDRQAGQVELAEEEFFTGLET